MTYYYIEFSPLLDSWYIEPLSKKPDPFIETPVLEGEIIIIHQESNTVQSAITQSEIMLKLALPDIYPQLLI